MMYLKMDKEKEKKKAFNSEGNCTFPNLRR